MASALDGLAGLAADQDAYENAALAYGAADAIRERLGTPRMPDERKIVDDKRASLRMLLGEEDLERLTSEGRGMESDAVLGWALESF